MNHLAARGKGSLFLENRAGSTTSAVMEGHTTCPETDCCFTLVEQPNPSFEASYWSRDKNVQKSKYQTYKGLVQTSVLRAKNSAKHLSLYVQKDKGPQKPSYTRQESWPKTLFGPHVL